MFRCRGAARFNSQSPQQNRSAEKFDDAVNSERLQQQTLRCPAEQERRGPFDRHPTDRDVREQQRLPYRIAAQSCTMHCFILDQVLFCQRASRP